MKEHHIYFIAIYMNDFRQVCLNVKYQIQAIREYWRHRESTDIFCFQSNFK